MQFLSITRIRNGSNDTANFRKSEKRIQYSPFHRRNPKSTEFQNEWKHSCSVSIRCRPRNKTESLGFNAKTWPQPSILAGGRSKLGLCLCSAFLLGFTLVRFDCVHFSFRRFFSTYRAEKRHAERKYSKILEHP